VLTSTGQSILYQLKRDFKDGKIEINTSSYPSGTYYLLVGTDAGTELREFTVVH
jgi:hypothetical protein